MANMNIHTIEIKAEAKLSVSRETADLCRSLIEAFLREHTDMRLLDFSDYEHDIIKLSFERHL